jgi:glycosyltransferase involved in cell wall biosynthesis
MRFPRAVQVARSLAALDERRLSIICADEPESDDRGLAAMYPDGDRRIVRVPWTKPARAYLRLRDRLLHDRLLVPDRYRPWLRAASRALEPLVTPASVLITFGQPMSDHLLGLRLRRQRRLPWIAHFSDPWTDSPFRQTSAPVAAANLRLERAVVEQADRLVFTSVETVELVMAKYTPALREKALVVPHAFDPRLYPEARPHPGSVVVRYLGAFYGDRTPLALFDALRALPTTLGLRVELIGSSESTLPATALAGLPPELVRIREPVPYLESLRLMRESDVLLVLDAPAEQSVFLPSKLVDYLGARRPIVALTCPGAAAELVRRFGGWVADPRDPRAGAAALAAAIESRSSGFGNRAVAAEYEVGRVSASFAAVVADLSAQRASRNRVSTSTTRTDA